MSTNYPTSLDDTTTMPLAVDNSTSVIAAHHNNQSDALIAVETKIGTGSSTPTSGTVLRGNGTGTSTWGDVVLTTDVTGTLPVANGGTGVTASTGTVAVVLSTTPTLVTPVLGVATATSINKVAITAPATSATLTIANGKTLTASNTITFTATDSSTLAIGTGGTLGTGAYATIANYAPLASPTFTGTVTLPKTLEIQDTSADHQYVLAVSELTTDRTITLPLLTGADEFVFKDHAVTMTNKTFTAPVLNGAITGDAIATGATINTGTANDDIVTSKAILDANIFTQAWTAFTPAWTNLTPGSGTNTGAYTRIGKTVIFRTYFKFAADSSISGAVTLTLPITAASYGGSTFIGQARLVSAGAGYVGLINSAGSVIPLNAAGTYLAVSALSSTVPATWTTNDEIEIQATYEGT